jgi:uncharacterized protein (TIGR03118 family)
MHPRHLRRVRQLRTLNFARAVASALEQLESRRLLSIAISGTTVTPTEGLAFSGTVATFTDTNAGAVAASFTASINWGDGATSPADGHGVIVTTDPNVAGQFDIGGTHTYTEEGTFNVTVNVTDTLDNSQATTSSFLEENLVTDSQTALAAAGFSPAAHTDPNLVNPWGIVASPTGSPFWVSDNGQGVATLYDGSGAPQALVVTIPASGNSGATAPAPVTGVVFNSSSTDFNVAGAGTAARFIFATEDGTIAAWNSGTTAVLKSDNSDFVNGPVYKGLAIASNGSANFLYAANFRSGAVDVLDTSFHKTLSFSDPGVPAGFAPFGIQNIGGKLYITYAEQNATKHDDVAGAGNGFVDVYNPVTNVLSRLVTQGVLNSPWGLALAPATFGPFAGDLLVGNFGDGRINAFDPVTGASLGSLVDANNLPVAVRPGPRGRSFSRPASTTKPMVCSAASPSPPAPRRRSVTRRCCPGTARRSAAARFRV